MGTQCTSRSRNITISSERSLNSYDGIKSAIEFPNCFLYTAIEFHATFQNDTQIFAVHLPRKRFAIQENAMRRESFGAESEVLGFLGSGPEGGEVL